MATPDELFAKAKEYMGNGNTAMEEREYQKALASFSQALYTSNSQIFSKRAEANIMLERYDEAVYDAMTAISFDSSNSNAYFRKGVACFYKKEYYTAKKALEAGFSLSPTDKRFPDWIDKCKSIGGVKCELTSDIVLDESSSELQVYSHEWTQTKMEAVLTVHAKGIVSDHVYVSFEDHMVVVTIDDNSGKPYVYTTRFINEISPQYSTYGAYTDYIEVRLAKSKHVDWILPDNSVDGECSTTGGETPKKVPSYSDILAKFTPPVSPCSSSPKGVGPASPICSSSPKGVGPASPVGERPAQPLTYPLLKKRQHGEIISLMDHKPPIGIRKRKKIRKRGDVSFKMRKMESDRLLKLYDDKHDEYLANKDKIGAADILAEAQKLLSDYKLQDWKENTESYHENNIDMVGSLIKFDLHELPRKAAGSMLAQLTRVDFWVEIVVGKGGTDRFGNDHGTPVIKNDAMRRLHRNKISINHPPQLDGTKNEGIIRFYLPHNCSLVLSPDTPPVPTTTPTPPPPTTTTPPPPPPPTTTTTPPPPPPTTTTTTTTQNQMIFGSFCPSMFTK